MASALLFTGAADGDGGQQHHGVDIASLVKSEKAINKGKTKLVEFKDSHGERKFYAKVGPRDKVSLRKTSDGSLEIGVKPYDPVTDAEVDKMAAEMQADVLGERRRPLPERGAAGRAAPSWGLVRPPEAIAAGSAGLIYSAGCLYITSEMYVKGCYERRRVPESIAGWYLRMDTSEISGHHVGTYGGLTGMKSRHDYDAGYAGTEVIKNRPAATIEAGSCRSQSIGINYEGIEVSHAIQVCPERLSPYVRAKYFHHAWSGRVWRDGDWRDSLGHSVVKARDGHSNGFDYRISAFQDDAFQNDSWVNAG
ncbi:MAG: hypothetical protein J7518_22915 [Nocardioidaceae bacterium]|nr:hypothetical protein [Nocardioidaceae bacterium]